MQTLGCPRGKSALSYRAHAQESLILRCLELAASRREEKHGVFLTAFVFLASWLSAAGVTYYLPVHFGHLYR